MRWMDRWRQHFRSLFRRARVEDELDREFRFHLEQQIEENRAAGMAPDEARRSALATLGGVTQLQEACRDMRGVQWIETLVQDLRYGLRTMGRNPGFTTVAVLTLALGIGANTAIFSLLDAVELRRLPVRHPEQLAEIQWTTEKPANWQGYSSYTGCDSRVGRKDACSFPYAIFDQFRSQSKSFESVFAFAGPAGVQALIRGEITPASAELVSGEFFATLGVPAQLGRVLDASDDRPGADATAVLSSAFWQAHFGSDPGIVGKTIALEGTPFTIVGVAPREFFGLQPIRIPSLWIAIHAGRKLGPGWWDALDDKNAWLPLIGRLAPGVTLEAAHAELEVLFRQSLPPDPGHAPGTAGQPGIRLVSAARGLAGMRMRYSQPLQVLMAVVGLVMLIACANIANLLLARSSVRRKEMAIRLAIGGGRRRLFRQLLTESALLATAGGVAGLLVAMWARRVLAALFTPSGERMLFDVRLNTTVFGFAAAVATLTAVLFGLAPALAGSQVEPVVALKSGTGAAGPVGRRSRFGWSLVAGEMALALLLLVGAGLFLRTLINLETLDPGFRRDHLLTFVVSRKHDGRPIESRPLLNAELQARLAALPGVVSATWSSEVLLAGNLETDRIRIEGKGDKDASVQIMRVGPRYFETLAIPILSGRNIRPEDCRPDADAVWVNHALAQRYFGGDDPLGTRIARGTRKFQIAGVVGDTKYETLRSEIAPTVYTPSNGGGVFQLRTAADPMSVAGAVPQAVHEVTPDLLVLDVKSESAQVDAQLFTEHVMARLSAVFGLLALVLASVGIYGVLAYSVTRRTGEIAIRTSLGAMPREIARMILADGLRPAAAGAAAGLAASFAVTRFIGGFLFGVAPVDLPTYAAATLFLLGVAALACYLPARRATKVDPIAALREE